MLIVIEPLLQLADNAIKYFVQESIIRTQLPRLTGAEK
jgi:hypothetical protein